MGDLLSYSLFGIIGIVANATDERANRWHRIAGIGRLAVQVEIVALGAAVRAATQHRNGRIAASCHYGGTRRDVGRGQGCLGAGQRLGIVVDALRKYLELDIRFKAQRYGAAGLIGCLDMIDCITLGMLCICVAVVGLQRHLGLHRADACLDNDHGGWRIVGAAVRDKLIDVQL